MLEIIENAVKKGIENEIFSGASAGVFSGRDQQVFFYSSGWTEFERKYHRVNSNTFFDLASLTKPLVTSLSIMKLVENGKLSLTSKLGEFFDFKGDIKAEITVGSLLSHSSGLAAHIKFYEKCESNCTEFIYNSILKLTPEYEREKKFIYSDLGFILLGRIIEIVTKKKLSEFWFETFAKPLSLQDAFSFSGKREFTDETCCLTKNLINPDKVHCGEVHDDNCRIMGGVAGHAGLFGNIKGVFAISKFLLDIVQGRVSSELISRKTLLTFFEKRPNSTWAYGFDTPSPLYSSSGKYFSKKSVGHLGFTGTSFWLDLEKDILIVLLTNRAYFPDSLTEMKKFRPFFHNTIMEHLQS